jgi:hypothetical protein
MQEDNGNAAAEEIASNELSAAITENDAPEAAPAAAAQEQQQQEEEDTEDISYQAVQKDGHVTAIWEMQGRKHLRTIDPRSREGLEILRLFTAEQEETAA